MPPAAASSGGMIHALSARRRGGPPRRSDEPVVSRVHRRAGIGEISGEREPAPDSWRGTDKPDGVRPKTWGDVQAVPGEGFIRSFP